MLFGGVIAVVLLSQVSATTNCETLCKHLSSNPLRYENCLWDCDVLDDCKKCEAPRCEDKPDGCNQATEQCRDTDNGRVCDCKNGFEKKDGKCVDIDECATNTANCNSNLQTCVNLQGSFECKDCPQGQISVNNKCTVKTCAHVQCKVNEVCVNADGPTCQCKPGYRSTVIGCIDIDECATNTANCNSNLQTCVNLQGSFECKDCPQGQISVNNKCTVKTCAHVQCKVNEVCVNADGPTCQCKPGYRSTVIGCIDIDECATNTANCNSNLQTCVNLQGSFECKDCPQGQISVNNKCTVKTCAHVQCKVNEVCVNADGPTCQCKPGYRSTVIGCLDIDECATHTANCKPNQICENLPGSYQCKECPTGQIPVNNECIGKTCKHVKCGEHEECKETRNGPKCECVKGYYYTVNGCEVKTCAFHTCEYNQVCIDTAYGPKCKCKKGYYYHEDKCKVATCATYKCEYNEVCKNTEHGPKCECQQGYYYHENACKAAAKCPHVKCSYNEYCYTKTGKCYPCKDICEKFTEGTDVYKSCYSYYCNGDYGRYTA
ncbi:fibrillin-1-like [Mytilus trossulus]|uniref:fibrillin-1-like n=1 Tax=Mytilus trossulus TaxID=6551 RepID=UPI00300609BB